MVDSLVVISSYHDCFITFCEIILSSYCIWMIWCIVSWNCTCPPFYFFRITWWSEYFDFLGLITIVGLALCSTAFSNHISNGLTTVQSDRVYVICADLLYVYDMPQSQPLVKLVISAINRRVSRVCNELDSKYAPTFWFGMFGKHSLYSENIRNFSCSIWNYLEEWLFIKQSFVVAKQLNNHFQ